MALPFRTSRFIDFDTGSVRISPDEYFRLFPDSPWTLSQKLDLFEYRVEVWQLGVSVAILQQIEAQKPPSIWCHSAYGLISVIFSYFEMIGKSLNPNSKKSRTAGEDFAYGFRDVYPRYTSTIVTAGEFCNRVRNGMYHLAYTQNQLDIHNDNNMSTEDFDIQHGRYLLNPHRLTRTVVDHFPGFLARLKDTDTKNDGLRKKFEEFFDASHV
jgi:hypothetical protein